jgi:hypothetical protein
MFRSVNKMLKRLTLPRPESSHEFLIHNGKLQQDFTWWEFYPAWEAFDRLDEMGVESPHPKLDEVLRSVKSHAKLWIGDWEGTIAPMDCQPQGWTYPSGKPLEPEWWWQWHPSSFAQTQAVATINMNSIEAWTANSPLKSGVPFQMQRNMGEVSAIEAIPVQRLPHLMKKEALWTFEYDF